MGDLLNYTAATWTLLILLSFQCVRWAFRAHPGQRLPPGPRSLPLIGNVHQLPAEYQERTFLEWGRKFGNIVFAKMFRTPVVIINSLEVAHDLLDRRSQYYSGRPVLTLVPELCVG